MYLRQLIFSRKNDCLGCAVLLCLVCLTLLASFFLPSHLSFKNMYMGIIVLVYIWMWCVQVFIDVLSAGDLQFVTHSLFPDIPPVLLHNMISFNSKVCMYSYLCFY